MPARRLTRRADGGHVTWTGSSYRPATTSTLPSRPSRTRTPRSCSPAASPTRATRKHTDTYPPTCFPHYAVAAGMRPAPTLSWPQACGCLPGADTRSPAGRSGSLSSKRSRAADQLTGTESALSAPASRREKSMSAVRHVTRPQDSPHLREERERTLHLTVKRRASETTSSGSAPTSPTGSRPTARNGRQSPPGGTTPHGSSSTATAAPKTRSTGPSTGARITNSGDRTSSRCPSSARNTTSSGSRPSGQPPPAARPRPTTNSSAPCSAPA